MIEFLSKPHLWAALALVCGVFAPVVPEVWSPYVKAVATAASGLVALCLQWQRESGGTKLPPPDFNFDYERFADILKAKTDPPPRVDAASNHPPKTFA